MHQFAHLSKGTNLTRQDGKLSDYSLNIEASSRTRERNKLNQI